VGIASVDQAKLDSVYAECKQLYVDGKLNSSGRLASGGVGVAAGGAVGVAGSAAAASAGLYGGMAVASATLVLMPVAIIGGAVGMAKIKRHKKEVAIQRVMDGCLHERGFEVAGWQKAPRTKQIKASQPALADNAAR
jgi:Na+/glutamate symporter